MLNHLFQHKADYKAVLKINPYSSVNLKRISIRQNISGKPKQDVLQLLLPWLSIRSQM